jgi:hypothetical protein
VLDAKAASLNEMGRMSGDLALAAFMEQFTLALRQWERAQPPQTAGND